jgi:S-formylglutathione hydrolase FrmB
MWQDIFGSPEETIRDGNDLFTLAQNTAARDDAPAIIQFCGTEDFLLQDNRKLNATLEALNWPDYHYTETPGTHNWGYWDKHIQDILKFFFKGEVYNG